MGELADVDSLITRRKGLANYPLIFQRYQQLVSLAERRNPFNPAIRVGYGHHRSEAIDRVPGARQIPLSFGALNLGLLSRLSRLQVRRRNGNVRNGD